MLIRTLIVEDEPAAQRFLTSLVMRLCPDFQIVAIAEDGRDAIARLAESAADIVITDVQMAPMDGIELAEYLRREHPEIRTVIVSGHDDFSYARGAIQAGVVEYLLKPVNPSEFGAMMNKLREQIQRGHHATMTQALLDAAQGSCQQPLSLSCMAEEGWLGAIRLGGREQTATELPDSQAIDGLCVLALPKERALVFALPGRKPREAIESLVATLARSAPFYAARMAHGTLSDRLHLLPQLLQEAEDMQVLGQVRIASSASSTTPGAAALAEEKSVLRQVKHVISGNMPALLDALFALLAVWAAHGCTLGWVRSRLLHILQNVYDHMPIEPSFSPSELALRVHQACRDAADYKDLETFCAELISALSSPPRPDGVTLISAIQSYIQTHIGEPLSTQDVCQAFGISASHLSQLFRRHADLSFVEYVTRQRVEQAKHLLKSYPDMPLKDIAQTLGFSDQFYFSKVFRAQTGVPPSEYRK